MSEHPAHAVGKPPARDRQQTSFAFVTDTHISVDDPGRTADLRRVMAHIDERNPDFALNAGDITEYGGAADLELYQSCIPSRLAAKFHHVPGNHESQWNADALETYRATFGPTHYSFDAGGFHVIGLDSMVAGDWEFYFGREVLDWVAADLEAAPEGMPVILLNHFPLGGRWHSVSDADALLRVIQPYPVRLSIAGHFHKVYVDTFNGLTQIVGNALPNGPYYYWAERTEDASGAALTISEVVVPEEGTISERVITSAPLTDPGPGGDFGPLTLQTAATQEVVSVGLKAPRNPKITNAVARLQPQGNSAGPWVPLVQSGTAWSGQVSTSGLPPGAHRVEVEVRSDEVPDAPTPYDAFHDDQMFDISTTEVKVSWSAQLPGRILGDLTQHGNAVVAATTAGTVTAFDVSATSARSLWSRTIGPVYKGAAYSPDGSLLLVGSADHGLYAFDGETGEQLWRRDLGAPVMSDVELGVVGDETFAFVSSGNTLSCLDLDGGVIWQASQGEGGVAAGSACCDGERVYVGTGTGNALALDARTGDPIWSAPCTDRLETSYTRLIFGPWNARMRLLAGDAVLATTVYAALALDCSTGAMKWTTTDDTLSRVSVTPPLVTDWGVLIFSGKDGSARLLDTATGTEKWADAALPVSFGAAPVPSQDPGLYWMVGHSGLMMRLDLRAGAATRVLQVGTAFTTSTGVLVNEASGSVFVSGAKDGLLRGITGVSIR